MINLINNSNDIHSNMGVSVPETRTNYNIVKTSECLATIDSVNSPMSRYDNQKMGFEDVMSLAGAMDVKLNSNYMTVMAHSVSDEDYGKMLSDGEDVYSADIKESVTILDEIKVKMAEAGIIIEGYNDDIDSNTLREITGNAAIAGEIERTFRENDIPLTRENAIATLDAVNYASEIEEITDGMCDYVLRNGIEPSIENLYRVRFSGTEHPMSAGGYYNDNGYLAKESGDYNWEGLDERFKNTIIEAGLEINERTVMESKWLVESGILYNSDNLAKLHELKSIETPVTVAESVEISAKAILNGMSPINAPIKVDGNLISKAKEIQEDVNNITDDAVAKAVVIDRNVTINSVLAAARIDGQGIAGSEYDDEIAKAQATMEQIRISMSITSNYRMLKLGIDVKSIAINELVNVQKALEDDTARTLFGNEDDIDTVKAKSELYVQSKQAVLEIPFLPAASIGEALSEGGYLTVGYVYKAGLAMKAQFDKMGQTYEAVGTEVRADLGDSIKKAFGNVDELLSENNMEQSDEYRRAVRILGYNRMEISRENIEKVAKADEDLQRVIDKMTPGAVLKLIRDNINPLDASLEDIEKALDSYDSEPLKAASDYSRFLVHLQNHGEITENERESYIGIYRLLHQIEKGDMAAVGAVVNTGSEMNFKNILSAVRSSKNTGIDAKISDELGTLAREAGYNLSISEQILKGFNNMLNGNEADLKKDAANVREDIKEILKDSQEAVTELVALNEKVSPDNIEGMKALMEGALESNPWEALKSMDKRIRKGEEALGSASNKEAGESDGLTALDEALAKLPESMTDKASMMDTMKEVIDKAGDVLKDMPMAESITTLDIKQLSVAYKQLSIMGRLSSEENYQVPVMIGDKLTGIRVKIQHRNQGERNVIAAFETEDYGRVMAQFRIQNGELNALVASNSEKGLGRLKEIDMAGAYLSDEYGNVNITYAHSENLDMSFFYKGHTPASDEVSTRALYDVATTFIRVISNS